MAIVLQLFLGAVALGLLGYWLWLVSLARRQIGLCNALIGCWERTPASERKPLPKPDMPGFVASLVFPKRSFFGALDHARAIVATMVNQRSYPGAPEREELGAILNREEQLCARALLSFASFNNLDHGPNGLYGVGVDSGYCGTCNAKLTTIQGGIIAGEPRQVLWCTRCMKLGSQRFATRL